MRCLGHSAAISAQTAIYVGTYLIMVAHGTRVPGDVQLLSHAVSYWPVVANIHLTKTIVVFELYVPTSNVLECCIQKICIAIKFCQSLPKPETHSLHVITSSLPEDNYFNSNQLKCCIMLVDAVSAYIVFNERTLIQV